MPNDYEDLQRMIDELKAITGCYFPPMKIERGYEIVDILQEMTLEEESEAKEIVEEISKDTMEPSEVVAVEPVSEAKTAEIEALKK